MGVSLFVRTLKNKTKIPSFSFLYINNSKETNLDIMAARTKAAIPIRKASSTLNDDRDNYLDKELENEKKQ